MVFTVQTNICSVLPNTLVFLASRNDFAVSVKRLSTQAIRSSLQTTVLNG